MKKKRNKITKKVKKIKNTMQTTLRIKHKKRGALTELLKALAVVAVCGLFCWLLTGCLGEDNEPVQVEKVLLVYLAGDNNLSGESADKLEAITRGYRPAACRRVLVYQDAKDMAPRLLELDEWGELKTLASYDRENSAGPEVFSRVVLKAKSLYPGASFNLLVFSHATGWLPRGGYSNPKSAPAPKSVLMDGADEMELAELAGAIPDHCFDYIVFEACHMAGIEVAWELRHKGAYIAASSAEIVSPGFTPLYGQYINELVEGDPEIFMCRAFDCFDSQTGYMRSATFSVIRTDGLQALAAYIGQHCDYSKPVAVDDIQHFDRGSYRLFCDFMDYHSRLLNTGDQIRQLQQLTEDCVTWKASTPYFMEGYNGFAIANHSGLTGYIMQDRYPALDSAYKDLGWYKAVNNGNGN